MDKELKEKLEDKVNGVKLSGENVKDVDLKEIRQELSKITHKVSSMIYELDRYANPRFHLGLKR